jgi:hypothetical protein
MTNQINETSHHVTQRLSGKQITDNENYYALREHIIRSFDEGRALAENKVTESLPFLLEKYYKNRLREDFPSICWGWNLTTRKRVCPQSPFAFIVGAPNSGTTLLFRILLEHPEIWGIFEESRLFTTCHSDREILATLFNWEHQTRQSGKSLILEKTPAHIGYWTRIHSLVPNHKFLFLLRDGRDNVASSVASYKRSHEEMTQVWIDALLEYETINRAFTEDVWLVHLKNLQQKPEQTMIDVLKFLGLRYSDKILSLILSYHERPRRFAGLSNDVPLEKPETITNVAAHNQLRCYQVNQPIQADTSRWQTEFPYEKYPKLHEKMAPWLIKYGYQEGNTEQTCKIQ